MVIGGGGGESGYGDLLDDMDSAIADEDYEMVSMNLTFLVGSMDGAMECLPVNIINDTLVEGDETLTVTLTLLTTGVGVTTGNNMTDLTITDNEGKEQSFNPVQLSALPCLKMALCLCPPC